MLKRKKVPFKVKALVKIFTRRSIIIPNLKVEVIVPEASKTATRTITRL